MESKAKFLGHPIHPMLIVFPLGLFVASVIFDSVYLVTSNAFFPAVSYYTMIIGIVGGLLAAIFGFRDYLAIPSGTRAKNIGTWHGIGNVTITALFIVSWFMRQNSPGYIPTTLAFFLTLLGVLMAGVTGWLGGELVDRLGVGVDPGANLDASRSISGRPIDNNIRQEEMQREGVSHAVPVTGESKYSEKHIEKSFSADVNDDIPPHIGPVGDYDSRDPNDRHTD
jgi:uncharacterized membrane protein